MSQEEILLIRQLKAGEEAAYQTVFQCYYPGLCVFAGRLLGDTDKAKEIVQDIFVRLYEQRNELPFVSSLKSYLYKAVYNTCLNQIRQAKVHQLHHRHIKQQTVTAEDTDELIHLELEEKIWQVVQSLPEQCRRIFRMNRFEGIKNKQIAEELGISVRTVETQISKALRILRKELIDFLPFVLMGITFL